MADLYLFSVIFFFLVLGAIIYADRRKIEFKSLMIMRRTKRFSDLIERITNISPKAWKIISTIGIIVCFYYMLNGAYMIFQTAYLIATGQLTTPGFSLILPSPSATGSVGPGYILIPFWFWLATIACILVPHETLHGIIARAEKIKLDSVGLMLILIFPGAFVEPDEKQLKKAKDISKLRIFSAGSFANFITAGIVFLLLSFIIWPAIASPGVQLITVNETGPAYEAGLRENMTIYQINGKAIKSSYSEYMSGAGYFTDEIGLPEENETLLITADNATYDVQTKLNENGAAYIGITYVPIMKSGTNIIIETIIPLLTMIWMFSFAVGMFNILPIYPLDGGLMLEVILKKYFKKSAKNMLKAITIIMVIIILFGFLAPNFLKF